METFSFSKVTTQFIQMRIDDDHGANNRAGFSEAAFIGESESIPEPTTLALMGLGLAGIGYRRRQLKKA